CPAGPRVGRCRAGFRPPSGGHRFRLPGPPRRMLTGSRA
ncbi:MAG: hypothetical protein AVDCRST_MAG87-1355, partial [uncultured Thermomicrobiales bacterium]